MKKITGIIVILLFVNIIVNAQRGSYDIVASAMDSIVGEEFTESELMINQGLVVFNGNKVKVVLSNSEHLYTILGSKKRESTDFVVDELNTYDNYGEKIPSYFMVSNENSDIFYILDYDSFRFTFLLKEI